MKKGVICFLAALIIIIYPCVSLAEDFKQLPPSAEAVALPSIDAESAMLVDLQTNTVLYQKNINTIRYPASLTKIMTALLVIESGIDLQTITTVSRKAVDVPYGSSIMGLQAGDKLSVLTLLYGLMLPSGNDAANALAECVSGSVESFVELMNRRAQELGMKDTHFINPHGFADETHYTTAKDMAILSCQYLKHEILSTISSTPSYYVTLERAEDGETGYKIKNGNSLITEGSNTDYVTGIKTGYTRLAGNCIIVRYQREGRDLLVLIFKSPQGSRNTDAIKLAEHGYNKYSTIDLAGVFQKRSIVVEVENYSADDEHNGQLELQMSSAAPVYYTTTASVAEKIISGSDILTIETPAKISAPIYSGDEIGKVTYRIDGEIIYSGQAIAGRTIFKYIDIPDDLVPINNPDSVSPIAAFFQNRLLWISLAAIAVLGAAAYLIIKMKMSRNRQMKRRRTTVFARERYRSKKYY